jgi:preprotein translocase subunit SecG
MLNNILLVVHVLIAVGIVGLILLQQGKGADAGAAFGGGASGTVFGSQGSGTFLSRATAILAALFFATSLWLAFLASEGEQPTDEFKETFKVEETVPAVDTTAPALPDEEAPTDAGAAAPAVTEDKAPAESKPAESKTGETKPAETKPAESKPATSLPE